MRFSEIAASNEGFYLMRLGYLDVCGMESESDGANASHRVAILFES